MRTVFAHRFRAPRRAAALAVVCACVVATAASPALAQPAQSHAGSTITMHWYSVVVSFVYTRADGTVVQQPPRAAAAGDKMDILELAYKGTHASHARKWGASSHTTCVFEKAGAAPVCEGESAVGGNQLLLFHTPPGGAPIVSGGTGRFAGASGRVRMNEIGGTDNSDIVITVHLEK